MKFLFCADLHIRNDTPVARVDDYITAQTEKLRFLRDQAEKHGATILCSGDIVHRARERKEPVTFINYLLEELPTMTGVLGNHDLLQHSVDALHHTTMGTLIKVGKYQWLTEPYYMLDVSITPFNWEQPITHNDNLRKCNLAVYHGMVTENVDPFLTGYVAKDLLDEFPEYDVILTGDNHKEFVVEKNGRFLVNPGSLKRDTTAQIDHTPAIYLYDTDTKILERIPVPIKENVISTDHRDRVKEREDRMEKVAEIYNHVSVSGLTDVEEGFKQFFRENEILADVRMLVQSWMGGG